MVVVIKAPGGNHPKACAQEAMPGLLLAWPSGPYGPHVDGAQHRACR